MLLRLSCISIFILVSLVTFGQKEERENFLRVDRKLTHFQKRSDAVSRSIYYELDTRKLNSRRRSDEKLLLEVPVFDQSVHLNLIKVDILSSHFQVKTARGEYVTDGSGYDFYQGYIAGKESSSIAVVTIRNDEFSLLMSDKNGDFQISRFNEDRFIGYYNNELKEKLEFECLVDDSSEVGKNTQTNRSAPSNECVDIYFEVDHAAFKKKNSNLTATTDWVVDLFNQVTIQYNRIGVPIRISEILIHTEPDPYAGHSDTHAVLGAFRQLRNQTGFNGRLAHLLSTRKLGGGVAYLNRLCSNFSNYAVSGNLSGGVTNYPNYSWNVMVIAHEMGHNFGSNHTQACVWNGNSTAIDGCADSEGSCDRPGLPVGGGTIMSYCHLRGNVGINLVKGFHEQPAALIYDKFLTADCTLSQDCSEVAAVNDECITATALPLHQSCINWSYNNIRSSQSSAVNAFSCGNASDVVDVWFLAEVPSSGMISIETNMINGGLTDMIMEIFSGTCTALVLEACDDNSGAGNHAKISIDDANLGGETIYIRIGDKGSDNEGEFSICAYSSSAPCHEDLVTFTDLYTTLNGPNWTNKSGWEDGASGDDCDVCQWYGVTCNNLGQVTALNLSNNNLTGSLTNDIANLTSIVHLDLSHNNLSGPLPEDIINMSNMSTLKLNNNSFFEQIPENFYFLRALTHLDLSNNGFAGPTPKLIAYNQSLDHIDLSDNLFSGCFDQSLYNKCNISFFSLSGNPNLPYGGETTQFCNDRSGADSDRDGYCYNLTDCDDNNPNVFDGNPDICDGLDNDCNGIIDDGYQNLVNEFLDINEDWNNNANWSLGHPPIACEEAWIGMNGENCILSMPLDTFNIKFKGLKIGVGSELIIPETTSFELTSSAQFENHGTLRINGYISSQKASTSINYGLRNFGEIHITNGGLGFQKQNNTVILNEASGLIVNDGNLNIYIHESDPEVENGIINHGTIISRRSMYVEGPMSGNHIILKPGSTFNISATEQWDQVSVQN